MKNRLILLLVYFIDRGGELTTWLGLLAILSWALKAQWSADQMNTIAQNCILAFGVVASVFPDQIAKLKAYAGHFIAGTVPGQGAAS